jgi:hypothetical protein
MGLSFKVVLNVCAVRHSAYFWRPEGQCGFRYVLFYFSRFRQKQLGLLHPSRHSNFTSKNDRLKNSGHQALKNKVIWGDLEKLSSFCVFWGNVLVKKYRNTNSILKWKQNCFSVFCFKRRNASVWKVTENEHGPAQWRKKQLKCVTCINYVVFVSIYYTNRTLLQSTLHSSDKSVISLTLWRTNLNHKSYAGLHHIVTTGRLIIT